MIDLPLLSERIILRHRDQFISQLREDCLAFAAEISHSAKLRSGRTQLSILFRYNNLTPQNTPGEGEVRADLDSDFNPDFASDLKSSLESQPPFSSASDSPTGPKNPKPEQTQISKGLARLVDIIKSGLKMEPEVFDVEQMKRQKALACYQAGDRVEAMIQQKGLQLDRAA